MNPNVFSDPLIFRLRTTIRLTFVNIFTVIVGIAVKFATDSQGLKGINTLNFNSSALIQ